MVHTKAKSKVFYKTSKRVQTTMIRYVQLNKKIIEFMGSLSVIWALTADKPFVQPN